MTWQCDVSAEVAALFEGAQALAPAPARQAPTPPRGRTPGDIERARRVAYQELDARHKARAALFQGLGT